MIAGVEFKSYESDSSELDEVVFEIRVPHYVLEQIDFTQAELDTMRRANLGVGTVKDMTESFRTILNKVEMLGEEENAG